MEKTLIYIYECFFYLFCATDLDFGTKKNGNGTLKTLIFLSYGGSLWNIGKRYEDDMGHFWSVAKIAIRFGCAKQSKNLMKNDRFIKSAADQNPNLNWPIWVLNFFKGEDQTSLFIIQKVLIMLAWLINLIHPQHF